MTFTLHLLRTHPGMSDDTLKFLNDAVEMLERIATTVRRVLAESSEGASDETSAVK